VRRGRDVRSPKARFLALDGRLGAGASPLSLRRLLLRLSCRFSNYLLGGTLPFAQRHMYLLFKRGAWWKTEKVGRAGCARGARVLASAIATRRLARGSRRATAAPLHALRRAAARSTTQARAHRLSGRRRGAARRKLPRGDRTTYRLPLPRGSARCRPRTARLPAANSRSLRLGAHPLASPSSCVDGRNRGKTAVLCAHASGRRRGIGAPRARCWRCYVCRRRRQPGAALALAYLW